jgi:hypothetical protein
MLCHACGSCFDVCRCHPVDMDASMVFAKMTLTGQPGPHVAGHPQLLAAHAGMVSSSRMLSSSCSQLQGDLLGYRLTSQQPSYVSRQFVKFRGRASCLEDRLIRCDKDCEQAILRILSLQLSAPPPGIVTGKGPQWACTAQQDPRSGACGSQSCRKAAGCRSPCPQCNQLHR